jgi:hypothetical protein
MNQVIISRGLRYEVSWKTPKGVFHYGCRDNVKEAFQLARWISRYYLRYEGQYEGVKYLPYSEKKKFTFSPEIIFVDN